MNSNCKNNSPSHKKDLSQNIQIDFFLRSPKPGKIFRGPNWRAFDKNSLGTIPRKSEKVLFKDRSQRNEFVFYSQVERFKEKIDSEKYAFPGPGKYSIDLDEMTKNHRKNPSFSSKGYGNGFLSNSERFDSLKEYYEKYLPGPGNYTTEKNTITDEINQSPLYKNLYNTDKITKKKAEDLENRPGPGDYDPPVSDFVIKSEENPNFFFASKAKRKMPYEQHQSIAPGPGRYRVNLKDFELVKDPNKTSHFFKNKENKKEENLETLVYSPIIEKLKKEIDFSKYKEMSQNLNLKINRNVSPGPCDYKISSSIGKSDEFSFQPSRIINQNDLERDKEKEKELEQINILKNIKKEAFLPYVSPFKNLKNSANYIFKSKIPNNDYIKTNHNPGPSYYIPAIVEKKSTFNMNLEKIWV